VTGSSIYGLSVVRPCVELAAQRLHPVRDDEQRFYVELDQGVACTEAAPVVE